MKIIAINGSPNENGSTRTALGIITTELERQGIETEIIHVGKGPIQGCTGCGGCRKAGKCVLADDVNIAADKIIAADGLILGSPTYYGSIAGGAKCFYDRLFFRKCGLVGKVATAVTVARRTGGEDAFHQLNSYLTLAGAVIAPTTYWNVIHGHNGEEIMRDAEGVEILQIVGRSMAWLVKSLDAAKDIVPQPDIKKNVATNFIR